MRIERNGDWLAANVGEELVMMSVTEGAYIGLNDVGRRIWELIEEPRDVDEIYTRLQAEFRVSRETCVNEVQTFLAELESRGAITFVTAPA